MNTYVVTRVSEDNEGFEHSETIVVNSPNEISVQDLFNMLAGKFDETYPISMIVTVINPTVINL